MFISNGDKMNTIDKLELACYKGEANAETFEKVIKAQGFTCEIMQIFVDYYAEDYKADTKRFN